MVCIGQIYVIFFTFTAVFSMDVTRMRRSYKVRDTPCAKGWLYFRYKCYKLGGVEDGKTWNEAADICTSHGGHLVSVHSKSELDFLTTHMIVNVKTSVWIGLNDQEKESEYKWHDGSPVNYTNWMRFEPTGDTYGNEDCAAMIFSHFSRQDDVSGQWNDESCGSQHPYICQIKTVVEDYCITKCGENSGVKCIGNRFDGTPVECKCKEDSQVFDEQSKACKVVTKEGDIPCEAGWLNFRSKCYRLGGVDDKKTWEDAATICTTYGGHLASIHSKAELDFLATHMVVNIKTSVWIGLNDREKESEYKWHDGSPVDYTNWMRYEPTGDTYGNEDCVAMIFNHFSRTDDVSGQWNDESCGSKLPYICQMKADTINYCPNPGSIASGRVVLIESIDKRRATDPVDDLEDEFPEGSQLEYSCNRGYAIEGAAVITCEASRQWSAKRPRCISVADTFTIHCVNPGSLSNGRVDVFTPGAIARSKLSEEKLEYPAGTRLEYACDDGFFLQGSNSMTCQSTGFWSPDLALQNCVPDCGRSFMQTTDKVSGGDKTANGQWPWVVAIARMENNYPSVICGGVLINSQTVLTAAHCLDNSKRYNLYFGTTNPRREYESVRRSTAMIYHPDYNEDSMDSDIGLIKFSPKIKFSKGIQPVCLPTGESTNRNLINGRMGHVAGWGYTELDMQSDDLLHASLPYLSNKQCIESYKRKRVNLDLTTNMFCAGHDNRSQSTCEGDSGSGLVFKNRLNQRYTVEGIVSFGVEGACGLAGQFQVFTKVIRFLDWIHRNWK